MNAGRAPGRSSAPGPAPATPGTAATAATAVATQTHADLLATSLMLMFVMSAITLSLMPVVTNQLRTEIGLGDAQIGLLTSVFMGFYGASGILSGIAAARWGGRLFAVSSACFVIGSLAFALSSSFPGFLLGRAVQGIGGGMVVATCNPVLARSVPAEKLGRAWGITGIGFGLGGMVALFALPPIQSAGGYQAACLTTAGLGLAIGVAVLCQRPVRALPRPGDMATSMRGLAGAFVAVVRNRRVLILGLCNTAGLAMGVAAVAWSPSFLQDIYGTPEATSMYLIAALGAAQMIGNPLGIFVAARWGLFRTLVFGVIATTVTTVLIGVLPGVAPIVAMIILAQAFNMFYFPVMLSYIPKVVGNPGHVGPATGMNSLLGFAGSLFAPWLFGLILDAGRQSAGAYTAGFVMLGAFGVVTLISLAFFKPGRQAVADR